MANWYHNIPMPLDANGREVPLDTRELVWCDKTREVWSIAYNATNGRWVADLADGIGLTRLSACTMPDSLERIADDIEASNGTAFISGSTLSKWAGRIRKLADENK